MVELPKLAASRGVVMVVDIDGTICTNTDGDYEAATPLESAIAKVNDYFHAGATIIYFTARGSTTGINWKPLTEAQLREWGALYHSLVMGKPFGDYYIDDKAVFSSVLLEA